MAGFVLMIQLDKHVFPPQMLSPVLFLRLIRNHLSRIQKQNFKNPYDSLLSFKVPHSHLVNKFPEFMLKKPGVIHQETHFFLNEKPPAKLAPNFDVPIISPTSETNPLELSFESLAQLRSWLHEEHPNTSEIPKKSQLRENSWHNQYVTSLAKKHRGFLFFLERFLNKRMTSCQLKQGCLLIVNLATLTKSIVKALRGAFWFCSSKPTWHFFLGGRMVTTGGTNGLDPLLVTAFQQLLLQPLKKDWISTRPGSGKRTGFVSRSFKITQKKLHFLVQYRCKSIRVYEVSRKSGVFG